ncbi:MAG: hypothetical protein R2769_03435 [Saprospiraceae bacterium]
MYVPKMETVLFLKITLDVIFNDSIYEDVDASWADLDNDGDLDLGCIWRKRIPAQG